MKMSSGCLRIVCEVGKMLSNLISMKPLKREQSKRFRSILKKKLPAPLAKEGFPMSHSKICKQSTSWVYPKMVTCLQVTIFIFYIIFILFTWFFSISYFSMRSYCSSKIYKFLLFIFFFSKIYFIHIIALFVFKILLFF